ncbi:hypothetical protein DH2020_038712 [Rehmannia glutinosa]|uniref:U6 snRNA-associated Sm-like protein LSm8 n=1 Tax=Rehmannia glutinosa TaxID=99300 RepID=A0ABR0UXW1_REHGL
MASGTGLESLVDRSSERFHQATNIILDESHERVYSTKEGVQQLVLGLYIIRGDNISIVGELDEELDASLDLSKLRAHPLKPLSYQPSICTSPKPPFHKSQSPKPDSHGYPSPEIQRDATGLLIGLQRLQQTGGIPRCPARTRLSTVVLRWPWGAYGMVRWRVAAEDDFSLGRRFPTGMSLGTSEERWVSAPAAARGTASIGCTL